MRDTVDTEGVIKFILEHTDVELGEVAGFDSLSRWRGVLRDLALIGQDPARYGGLGFGNVSMRTTRGFIVSGTQTGDIESPGLAHYAEVVDWDVRKNRVVSHGRARPSSESLTHAAVYSDRPAVCFVFHVHSPDIWGLADRLNVPSTPVDVAYGTPQMAAAVADVCRDERRGVFAMAGHTDGVVAYGGDARSTGLALLAVLAASHALGAAIEK